MEYHGNLLSTEFFSVEFLKNCVILEKRKSLKDPWMHCLVSISAKKIEEAIVRIQKNLLPQKYYAHLYNEDGSDVIVIFPQRIFHLSINNTAGWEELHKYMLDFGIPEHQSDPKPKTFIEEEAYYKEKPLVNE